MEVEDPTLAQPPLSPNKRSRPSSKEFQRAYKACIPCRKRKAKCDMGRDSIHPCARCRREHRECIFSAERNYSKRQKIEDHSHFDAVNSSSRVPRTGEAIHSRDRKSTSYETDLHISPTDAPQFALPKANLADSVIRRVVSSGHDALRILFEAAAHQGDLGESPPAGKPPPPSLTTRRTASSHHTSGSALSPDTAVPASGDVKLSQPSIDVVKLWNKCRFVKTGWLSAVEAVTFVDLFFRNMCPLSPLVTNYYENHDHHLQLLTEEPLLVTTILMISSRHHLLPCVGAASRGFFMHEKFWSYCQHLIQRIMYGQEKSSNARIRTIGSIEALLLISDWHPRALHFPPDSYEGWDASVYTSLDEDEDRPGVQAVSSTSTRWLEDVIDPAKRSDRMSWMLLGAALTLAHELGVFDDDEHVSSNGLKPGGLDDINSSEVRKLRMRKLLYVYINQLASRLGCPSMFPSNLTQATMAPAHGQDNVWQSHMASWIELTKLVRSASESFFLSPSVTRQLLNSGRYTGLLDHFIPLLQQWRRKHLGSPHFQGPYEDTLSIEYHYARIYINSIGVEAACQRAFSEMDNESDNAPMPTVLESHDHAFVNEVIDGGIQILERTIKLAEAGTLRFCPVRTFLRITTSSVFLLKAISLGIRNAELLGALDTLDRTVQAMRLSRFDDVHLAARYASVLEIHVARLRRGFMVSSQKQARLSRMATRQGSPSDGHREDAIETSSADELVQADVNGSTSGQDLLPLDEMSADDYLWLPFDPSMAPFAAEGFYGFPALDGNALDFIWNLPAG